jgi:hypothetical protein
MLQEICLYLIILGFAFMLYRIEAKIDQIIQKITPGHKPNPPWSNPPPLNLKRPRKATPAPPPKKYV